jgi:hypothetical protein
LYERENWSLALREEHKLRMLENRVLTKTFGLMTDEGTEGLKKLYNEELRKLWYSPNIIRVIKSGRMRWMVHVYIGGDEKYI